MVNKELKDKFLDYFRKLPIQKLAADYIGRSEDTISDWKKDDTEFANQIATAKSEWALDKVGKVRSKEWLLERIMNDHFSAKTPDPAVQINNYQNMTDEQLDKIIESKARKARVSESVTGEGETGQE